MAALQIVSYDVTVDLTEDADTFSSRTEVRFACSEPGAGATADLHAAQLQRAVLNGTDLPASAADERGLLLARLDSDNALVVEAEFAYAQPGGVGLLRDTGPDGSACVYSKSYPAGSPRIFCCFDQPELRAPVTLAVRAPAGWSCLGNAPAAGRQPGQASALWTFTATRPIVPLLFGMCAGLSAGPAFCCDRGDGPPLTVTAHAVPVAAGQLDALNAETLLGPLLYYEQALGVRYPDEKCDVVFVPHFGALAFGAPGLLSIRAEVLNPAGKPAAYLPLVIAHELSHAWFGGLVEFQPPEDGWVEEAVATYVSRCAVQAGRPHVTAWSDETSRALPDHAYAGYAAPLKQLETMIGQQAVMQGLGDLLRVHANGTVTKDDLVRSWSLAGGRDLGDWAASELRPRNPADHLCG